MASAVPRSALDSNDASLEAEASGGVAASPPGSALMGAEDERFAVRKAELTTGRPSVWQGSGLKLGAPAKRRFTQVLTADFDADDKLDALAWLTPASRAADTPEGELWYFPNGAPPRQVSALPSFVPSGADCVVRPTLTQTGPRSATLDVNATCQAALVARTATRALVVISPAAEKPLLSILRAAPAAPGEALDFAVDSSDRDGDGRDDVRLTVSVMKLATSEPAQAELAFFDRAAGISRSANEPLESLTKAAEALAARPRKRADYRTEASDNIYRLLSTLCAEGGVARVFDEDGAAFRCGDLTRVIDALSASEVRAALVAGDVLGAFAVLTRDGWYFRNAALPSRKASERELLHSVTKLEFAAPYVAKAAPFVLEGPHYSPLWFEADGALLIQSSGGVARVAASRSQEEVVTSDAGVPAWPLPLTSPSGERITGVSHACDRSELLLDRTDARGSISTSISTRLLAARPASCTGHGAGPPVVIAPLRFDESGLEALIAGSLVTSESVRVGSTGSPPAKVGLLPALGTPRSADGRWLVTPTPLGLLVTGDKSELWQPGASAAHGNVGGWSDCVVANDARAVACIDAGEVLIFERGKPSAASKHK